MHISGLKNSKFISRADVAKPILVTIKDVYQDNVAREDSEPDMKWCLSFSDYAKPMVLNNTNAQIIAAVLKDEETDNWKGHKIVVYDDPNVSFGGKLTGGVRVRAPKNQPAPAKPTPAPQPEASDDDVPF